MNDSEVSDIKISIDVCENYKTTEIIIKSPQMDDNLNKLIEQIKQYDISFQGKKDDSLYTLQADQIFYIESIDNQTFLYTEHALFESHLKLYKVEKMAVSTHFFRISKNLIVNTSKIESVRALFNGKIEATLKNGEKVIVNRHYVKAFKAFFIGS